MGAENLMSRRLVPFFMIFTVLVGSVAVYESFALNESNQSLSSADQRVLLLQNATAALQERNEVLQEQLGDVHQTNVSLVGLDPSQIYQTANESVVTIQGTKVVSVDTIFGPAASTEEVLGSGFVIEYSNSYYILTNFHVVDGITNASVTFWNGDSSPMTIVGTDAYSDLAVVKTSAPPTDFDPLRFASSLALQVGDPVLAIGNPFGLSASLSFGIVSQLGRSIQYQSTSNNFLIADVIQFSAPINPGNSGGPLLDANGLVVGITSAIAEGSQGVGFAIPSATILRELSSLIATGSYDMHPYIGINGVDMNYQLAQMTLSNVTYGVLIENVITGGPADKAGLLGGEQNVTIAGTQYVVGGDIIISINGNRIVNFDALSAFLERFTLPGETVQIGIVRSGNYEVVMLVLGTRPQI
jgi:S1-C subfamily serine protease